LKKKQKPQFSVEVGGLEQNHQAPVLLLVGLTIKRVPSIGQNHIATKKVYAKSVLLL